MIVNPYSVSALTIDAASFGLAAVAVVKTIKLLLSRSSDDLETGESITKRENDLYLLFWLGTVLLIIRLLSWPFFYLVLHSFVSEVVGAMCIYGATKLLPRLTLFLESSKVLLFFCGMLWLLLFRLERLNETNGAKRAKAVSTMLLLLAFCSGLALFESGGSVILWIRSSAELAVSCCTTITDIPNRFTVWIPETLLGNQYELPLWFAYFGINGVLLVFGCLGLAQFAKRGIRPSWLVFLSFSALLAGGVTLLATIELIAPHLMGLSFHHCIYCFIQTTVDGALILLLVITGTFLLAALTPIYLLAHSWTEERLLGNVLSRCMVIGLLGFGGSLVMVSVHLLL